MRPRTTVARRAVRVLLLLGGFLVLAFILSGQAHADAPDIQFVRSASNPSPVAVDSVTRGAEQSVTAGTAQAGRSVVDTVAAATASGTVQPVTGLIGTVQGATHQATSPVVTVVHTIGAVPGSSPHGAVGGHVSVTRTAGRTDAGTWSAVPAPRASSLRPARDAGPQGAHAGRVTHPLTPGQLPASTQHSEHPVESDGSAHHEGGAYAAVPAAGTRLHLSAVARSAAHGSAPLQRPSDVSVQPD